MIDDNTRRFWVTHEEQARLIEKLGKDWDKQVSGVATVTFKNQTIETDSIFDISELDTVPLSKFEALQRIIRGHKLLEAAKPRPAIVKPSNNPWYRKFAK